MVNLNSATKLHITLKTDEVLQKIDDSCGSSPPEGRRLLEKIDRDLSIQCSFKPPSSSFLASQDEKTLYVEEGVGKVNTGLFYEIQVRSFLPIFY